MMSLPTARRRAEELDVALAQRTGDGAPAPRPELAPLLEVVAALRAERSTAPAPRADFAADLRARLLAEADTALVPAPATDEDLLRLPRREHPPHRRRSLVAAASVAVLAGGSSTMAYAAQDALPGDSLYPVKRALEGARGTISLTDASRGTVTLRHAEQRLAEVQGLVERDDAASTSYVVDSLTTFGEQADEAATLLIGDGTSGDDTDATRLREFVRDSLGTLAPLEPALTGDAKTALADVVGTLQSIDDRALTLCPDCGSGAAVELPFSLASAVALAEAGLADDPLKLPTVDSAAGLPPGSVSGGAGSLGVPLQAPAPAPSTPADPTQAPQAPSTPATPDTPAAPPAGTTPTVPALPPVPGTGGTGVTGTTDGVLGLTGPLAEPLRQLTAPLTETLDEILGLGGTRP
ncbi:hypothetical protein INN71_11070 [Nocardioides sp. ChNu-153]|uniref:DUF5667 domain-containing protein n=1 Tax=unclassified Nocardioides TaxID=2615069 RepID=UPI002406E491|nr:MULTISPECIES: DUF5667 domain-containing protein [unclassified Nocardioides]MDF9716720.1 hypothetical protein [Nocardioides sp. ChNu-99]MDN7121932.1 hypothetical protein [Nocardioides sp. ChNu-153]